jgi:hypothetical protein
MRLFDQLSDRNFTRLIEAMERSARDKISSKGVVVVSKYRRNAFDIGDILENLIPSMPQDNFDSVKDLMTHMLSGVEDMKVRVRVPQDMDSFRPSLSKMFECAVPEQGLFPINDPLQALMSLMYAKAQGAPQSIVLRIQMPVSDFFGPRTAEHIDNVIESVPEKMITHPSNDVREEAPEIMDGFPSVHTFVPELMSSIKKLNDSTRGKLDDLLKIIVDKYKDSKDMTVSDREFQKQVLDSIKEVLDEGEVFELSKKTPKDIVFNTKLPANRPGIIKVKDIILDRKKLANMSYKECKNSFSPQVADAIFSDDKSRIDVELITRLIERLKDLEMPEEERKEIDDRMLNPIKHFFEPDEDVVDKIMVNLNAR